MQGCVKSQYYEEDYGNDYDRVTMTMMLIAYGPWLMADCVMKIIFGFQL